RDTSREAKSDYPPCPQNKDKRAICKKVNPVTKVPRMMKKNNSPKGKQGASFSQRGNDFGKQDQVMRLPLGGIMK
uniref:Uncharacterized protein n=1 Tax=Myotis lucifugus TaxID=59463 RepID=G1Q6W4_MYOLU